MDDRPYRAALIGLGRIADTIDDEVVGSGWLEPFSHMGSYMDVPEVQVVGAADKYREQREAFGRRWGVPEDKLSRLLPNHIWDKEEGKLVTLDDRATGAGPGLLAVSRAAS